MRDVTPVWNAKVLSFVHPTMQPNLLTNTSVQYKDGKNVATVVSVIQAVVRLRPKHIWHRKLVRYKYFVGGGVGKILCKSYEDSMFFYFFYFQAITEWKTKGVTQRVVDYKHNRDQRRTNEKTCTHTHLHNLIHTKTHTWVQPTGWGISLSPKEEETGTDKTQLAAACHNFGPLSVYLQLVCMWECVCMYVQSVWHLPSRTAHLLD